MTQASSANPLFDHHAHPRFEEITPEHTKEAVPVLLGWGDPGVSVTAAIQLGSIVAVIAYFRADLAQV